MSQPIGKKRIHELEIYRNPPTGGTLLFTKEQREYQLPIEKLLSTDTPIELAAVKTEFNKYFNELKIRSGKLSGVYRYLTKSGGINWYFLFLAMIESCGKGFTLQDRKVVAEKAIRYGLFVPFTTETTYAQGQRIVVGDKLFMVNIAGTTAATVPEVKATQPGQFVVSGTATLECLPVVAKSIPSSWSYFFADIDVNLLTPVAPDSTDSYASLWIALIGSFADRAWLNQSSGVGSLTHWQLIKEVAKANLLDQYHTNKLVRVFQNNDAPAGKTYEQYFCQDNCEVYLGFERLKNLATIAEETDYVSEIEAKLTSLKEGILALWDSKNKRFLTYAGESDWTTTPSDKRFVEKDRFSVAPWRFGILNEEEITSHGEPALQAILNSYPGLLTDTLDQFALTDFFSWLAQVTNSERVISTVLRRVAEREVTHVTLTDVTAALVAASWGEIPNQGLDGYARINGKSVIGDTDFVIRELKTKHIVPNDNAQVVVSDIDDDYVLFVDNESALNYLQFKIISPASDGSNLTINANKAIAKVSFIADGVSVVSEQTTIADGGSITLTYNASTKTWLNANPFVINSDSKNIATLQQGKLTVNGTHPVIPKIDAKTLSGNMVVEKTLTGGAVICKTTVDVNNRLGVSQLSGVSIYSQCLLENKLVYLAADGSIIDAYFYVSNTKTTASTITHTIRVVLAKIPSKVINIDDLSETEVQYENGNLPVKIVIKHLAGTTLSQNGMK